MVGANESVRTTFKREIDRVYQHVLRACAEVENVAEVADAVRTKLARTASATLDEAHPPMAALAQRLALSHEQCELLWAIVGCSLDPRIVPHVETLGGAHARRGLSLTTYAVLADLDRDSIMRLAEWLGSPNNPLVSTGLLLVTEQASLAARGYAASARLVSFLAGTKEGIEPLRIVRASRPLLHDRRQSAALDELAAALGRSTDPIVVLEGPIGSGRTTAYACASGRDMLVLDCDRIGNEHLADGLLALRRETLLCAGVPVLANADHVLGEEQRDARRLVGEFIDRAVGPLVVTVTVPGTDIGTRRPVVRVPWNVPDSGVRAQLWTAAVHSIGASLKGDVAALAFRYRVGPAAIGRAVASARMSHPVGAPLDEAALAAGLRHNIAERLGGLARRIEVTQTWDDLVLAEDTHDLINALVGRIRHAHRVLDE